MTGTPAPSGHPPVTTQAVPTTAGQSVISYFYLRRAIGILGVLMPAAVWFIGYLDHLDPQVYDTISSHYYSRARDVFVGIMALIGVLVFFYHSPIRWENTVARITGIAGVFIGILPMDPTGKMRGYMDHTLFEHLHRYPVIAFFAGGLYLVAFSFRRTTTIQEHDHQKIEVTSPFPGVKKSRRNHWYTACAAVMTVSLALLITALLNGWTGAPKYVPESLAIISFAVAWLVKGQTWRAVQETVQDSISSAPESRSQHA